MRSRPASTRRRERSPQRRRTLALASVAAVLAGVSLAGCERTVIVEPAKDAANPKCADIMLTLPDQISGEQARTTSSQGTKAWGDPNIAVLRCGVTPPGPTTDRCVSVSGVDWISQPADDDDTTWKFTSYGRTPAVEVLVNRKAESGNDVLAAVSPALAKIKPETECVGSEDLEG
ncbi:DUF3515 domain-containing protein [Brevibacterium renqingii]|uniref:DUF3515 domain-containing protein n=1 Tax=Brevibacterium renqingii TaxID=2776916 RepID=UPI001AE0957D|nr:DUF3515 domain-containing protein [Brevibacterium renqingii]